MLMLSSLHLKVQEQAYAGISLPVQVLIQATQSFRILQEKLRNVQLHWVLQLVQVTSSLLHLNRRFTAILQVNVGY